MDDEFSAVATNLHRRLFDDIEFSKRQQWAVTNYVVLVYAGIFYLAGHFKEHATCAKAALSVLALIAGAYAGFLLIKMQLDMAGYRKKLVSANGKWLTDTEKDTFKPTDYAGHPAWRGVDFLIGLLGVDVIGWLLLMAVFWFGTF